ncbi:MAG TPA: GntR family transcriptional regulator [Streptosporangiaceae bacterium]|nr:GntR family transcriptional regulator [Streptosporangiaceae bacterium]
MNRDRQDPDHGPGRQLRTLVGIAPRHELIYEDLCARIRSGEYPLDSQLPSERELTELYGVSRPTIRQALTRAENDGIIAKVPGRGNFVSRRRVSQDLSRMQTFRSVISALDMKPSYRVLAARWTTPEPPVAKRLHVAEDASVLQVDSVGMASGHPMATYRSLLPPLTAADVHARLPSATASTYELAAVALGLAELRVDQTFESIAADKTAARLLQVPLGSSAFRVTSLFTTPEGEPVEFRTAIYPGGRYSFHIRRIVPISP